MDSFIWLIFAHYIGDFAFQTDWMLINKRKYWNVLIGHAVVWSACISMALLYIGNFSLLKVLFLVVVHFGIDKWKMNETKEGLADNKYVLIDQLLHIWQLFIVYV